jgi:hypothetical protein
VEQFVDALDLSFRHGETSDYSNRVLVDAPRRRALPAYNRSILTRCLHDMQVVTLHPSNQKSDIKNRQWFSVPVRSPLVLLLALILSPALLHAQAGPPVAGPQGRRPSPDELKRDAERAKAMNKDRAERIKRDTDKLLALATELKQYVDKTNENVLSVDVIRKADEIDKLAKSIREKMKEDYRIPDTSLLP